MTILDETPSLKICSRCGLSKPLTAFNRHRLRKAGLDSRCKECNAETGKDWYRRRQQDTNGLYSTYMGMKGRCYTPTHQNFAFYGGRGITVCDEWLKDFGAFVSWARSNGYRPDKQLDRIDNDKGYSPGNCRFVSVAENQRNKRKRTPP
jgi:hypothetical protein